MSTEEHIHCNALEQVTGIMFEIMQNFDIANVQNLVWYHARYSSEHENNDIYLSDMADGQK